ncbi:MAG TPA: hypothetical protein VNL74_03915 [Methylococcus sp.]|nr:hypothetical protein [Methylococcus sp.]
MMPSILPGWFWAGVTVASMAGAGFAGYRHAASIGAEKFAQCRLEIEQKAREAAELSARRIAQAQAAADAAIAEESRRREISERRQRELRHEVQRLAQGRPCLSGDLSRRLQQHPAFAGFGLSAAASGAAPAPAAPAADPGEREATDADLARWILDASGLYEQCRGRIDALREWAGGSR